MQFRAEQEMARKTEARIDWSKHGDLLLMTANDCKRAIVYWEDGWWGIGIIDAVGHPVNVVFSTRKSEVQRLMVAEYRKWGRR